MLENLNVFSPRAKHKFKLMHKDLVVLDFEFLSGFIENAVYLDFVIVRNTDRFPKYLQDIFENPERLEGWLSARFIPRNRMFRDEILKGLGDSSLVGKLKLTLGLSVTDSFWIQPEGYNLSWDNINLFDNPLDTNIQNLAFIGFGEYHVNHIVTSPEFTTNGILRKTWRRHDDGSLWLYKSGSEGASNAGMEPYSEFLASQVANAMGIEHVKYDLVKYKGLLCSICSIMTSKDVSLVSFYQRHGSKLERVLPTLSESYRTSLSDMFIFDFIIMNEDRHLGNFGFLTDNNYSDIGVAPVFDHGLSLLNYFVPEKYSIEEVEDYLRQKELTFFKIGASHYIEVSKAVTPRLKEKLRKLVNFEFVNHPIYKIDERRLKLLSEVIRHRVHKLLG